MRQEKICGTLWQQQQQCESGLEPTGADPLRALISDGSINSILLSSLSTLVFYSLINKQLNGNYPDMGAAIPASPGTPCMHACMCVCECAHTRVFVIYWYLRVKL